MSKGKRIVWVILGLSMAAAASVYAAMESSPPGETLPPTAPAAAQAPESSPPVSTPNKESIVSGIQNSETMAEDEDGMDNDNAVIGMASLQGTAEGSPIEGEADFVETADGLSINIEVFNVPNPGRHGLHIHENGSCADAAKAAGGHFNPDNVQHGLVMKDGHEKAHAGDLGNIDIKEDGSGSLSVFLPGYGLTKGKYIVAGKAIVLHEKEDDFGQPTGNAGGRIGCGVIEAAE